MENLKALLTLLEDEDPKIVRLVQERFGQVAQSQRDLLESLLQDSDPAIRNRVQSVLEEWRFGRLAESFRHWGLQLEGPMGLEQGVFLLAQYRYAEIIVDDYAHLMDMMVKDLRLRMGSLLRPEQILREINAYLFDDLGFRGDVQNYYNPENSYMNRVLDRRLGMPITLSVVYILLAKRLKLPIYGIGMPGHFICRYGEESLNLYFDPFNRGRLLIRDDCVQFLESNGYGFQEEYLAVATPKEIIQRMINNLLKIYGETQQIFHIENLTRLQACLGFVPY